MYFSRQIYLYGFYISKLNNLKDIHDLYFQCLNLNLVQNNFLFKYGVSILELAVVIVRLERNSDFFSHSCLVVSQLNSLNFVEYS